MCIGSMTTLQAQFYSYKQHKDRAEGAYEMGNYIEAMIHFEKANDMNDGLEEQHIQQYADAAYNTYSLDLADSLYTNYLEMDVVEDAHVARFRLAKIEMLKSNYQEAIMDFDLYLSEYAEVDSNLTKEVEFLKSSADWAINQDIESEYFPGEAAENVNSPYSEHAPYLMGDDLYYSALKFPIEDDKLKRLSSKILREQDVVPMSGMSQSSIISHPTFTPDEKHVFFTVGEYIDLNNIRCEIYYAPVEDDGQIGKSIRLPDYINRKGYTSTQPSISYNRDSSLQMLYVTNRAGGSGGLDIWKVNFDKDYNFEEPKNLLGLNTERNDVSPYHHEETGTLYFSSDGRLGFGGFDVYKVDYEGFVNGDISNLGDDINSAHNDLYFFLSDDEKESYLSSNRPGSLYIDNQFESCCYDIYKSNAKLCTVDFELLAYDANSNDAIEDVMVTIKDKSTREIIHTGVVADSNQIIELPCNDNMEMTVSKQGYADVITDLERLGGIPGQDNSFTQEVYMQPLDYSLIVKVLDAKTGELMPGASVYLTDLSTLSVSEKLNNPTGTFTFPTDPNTRYTIEANKEGYKESSIEVVTKIDQVTMEQVIELRLLDKVEKAVISLAQAIPVSMYFDNDQPDSGTLNVTSTKNYTQAYEAYYKRKSKFKEVYMSRSKNKADASAKIEAFFEGEVRKGNEKYEFFKKQLLLVLENGQEANIYLRGFASPVAESDYNTALGRRRIDSVRKEFYQWKSGILVKYIDNGQLKITERSFGESTSPGEVSDNINAPALSIYSPSASRERRVEIDEIQFNKN